MEDWTEEEDLASVDILIAAERLASSRGASTSSPAPAVASSNSSEGSRRIVTRSRARAKAQQVESSRPEISPSKADAEQNGQQDELHSADSNCIEVPVLSPSRTGVEPDPTAAMAKAVAKCAVVPDVEDIGRVLDRRSLRPHGFSVTDITAAEWCQQQFALALTAQLPRVGGRFKACLCMAGRQQCF